MSKVPVLETSRLLLREITEADAPSYERHFVDYEVIGELASVVPWPFPEGGVLEYIKTQMLPRQGTDRWTWGITFKQNPEEVIGCVDLMREAHPANRGFWLGRKFWGRGIMTEAVTSIMDYAFDHLGFEKLVFCNALGNVRSRRIKEKTGARLVRVEPGDFVRPGYTRQEIWEITKQEWQELRS